MTDMANLDHQKMEIKPRHMDFQFGTLNNLKFCDNNIYKSAFMAGLSGSFPAGEKEFLDSVRNYRDQIKSPDLLKQVKGFIGQEGHHSHQHNIVNEELDRLGFRTDLVDLALSKVINKRIKSLDNKWRLAITVSLEHLTAIMADYVINHPEFMSGIEAPFKDLMFWHAVEEVEHKSVAFDVYMECEGDVEFLHKTMKAATRVFLFNQFRFTLMLVFRTKYWPNWEELKQYMKWMFGKGGMWQGVTKSYKAFFSAGFHPWRDGGQEIIEKWQNDYYRAEQNKDSPEYLSAHPA